jgi:hypothetical protein
MMLRAATMGMLEDCHGAARLAMTGGSVFILRLFDRLRAQDERGFAHGVLVEPWAQDERGSCDVGAGTLQMLI